MHLIEKNSKHPVRDLTQAERVLLLKQQQNTTLSQTELKTLTEFYHDCRDKKRWLVCDCLCDGRPVFMTITKRDCGSIFLTRMQPHAHACPFYAEPSPGNSDSFTVSSRIKKNAILKLHTIAYIKNEEKKPKPSSENFANRTPKLARLLYTLICDAGLHSLKEKIPLPQQYQRLIAAAGNYRVSEQLFLKDVLVTHPKSVFALYKNLIGKEPLFKSPHKPYGVGIVIADHIEGNTLLCRSQQEYLSIKLAGRLQFVSGRVGHGSAPYIVILTVTDTEAKSGFYVPMHGFACPVLSKAELTPVDSRYERMVIHALLKRQQWWNENKLKVVIEKPLFSEEIIEQGERRFVLPDVVIKSPCIECILEVGGSHAPDYLERKLTMHERMRLKCPVFNFDALQAELEKKFEADLAQIIKRISSFLFKENLKI